jgi:hypothetical protein
MENEKSRLLLAFGKAVVNSAAEAGLELTGVVLVSPTGGTMFLEKVATVDERDTLVRQIREAAGHLEAFDPATGKRVES